MSAAEKLDSSKEYIRLALNDLASIILHDECGWDDYTDTYQRKVQEAFDKLINVRDLLDNK